MIDRNSRYWRSAAARAAKDSRDGEVARLKARIQELEDQIEALRVARVPASPFRKEGET